MPIAVQDSTRAAPRPQLWRITDRASFQALRQRGRRSRRGALTATFLAPDPTGLVAPPRVGFAIGKSAGGAVVRNRVRRRLRAALRELALAGRLPAGTYLVGATAEVARMPWSEVVSVTSDLVDEVTR